MTNPKKNSSPAHLSLLTGGSDSRTPRRRRSIVRELFGKFRSKSPVPAAVNDASAATLAFSSAQGNIKASPLSPIISIPTANIGASTGHASLSTSNVSNAAMTSTTTDLSTLSLGSPSSFTPTTLSAKVRGQGLTGPPSSATKETTTLTPGPDIFPKNNVNRVNINIDAPEVGHDFESTAQLAICAGLLNQIVKSASSSSSTASIAYAPSFSSLSVSQQAWILEMEKSPGEKRHLDGLMARMVNQFVSNNLKGSETIREIILLGSVLNHELYKTLLDCFLKRLDRSVLLDVNVLLGLVQLIQEAPKDCLAADDMNRILSCLRRRFDSSQIGKDELAHLVLAITLILILLVPCQTTGLDRVKEHEPLLELLLELRKNDDPLVRYQADYACQSLLSIPDDETPRQEFCRQFLGLSSGLLKMSGISRLELNGIAEGLPDTIKGARGLFDFFKKELGSGGETPWFKAVQETEHYADRGDFSRLKDLVCDPRHGQETKFLWGISRLLGEIAADPSWEVSIREQAVGFLGEIFKTSTESKKHKDMPRWILTILGHLSNLSNLDSSGTISPPTIPANTTVKAKAQTLILSLKRSGDNEFEYLHPLRIGLPLPKSSLLLRNVNDHPDLDHAIYKLQHERQSEYRERPSIFIQPLAKASLEASDQNSIPMQTRAKEFLEGEAQVMLILGDSGAGKSTFNRYLEHKLWNEYRPGESRIPLFINLPEIDHPEKDMIEKQLRMYKFSELHIKELKQHRRFLLICDGYDEAQLKSNLHTSNLLNKKGQPDAKMIVGCRSTFIGQNHSDLFSPQANDRYRSNRADLYTEAVIIPFSRDQIEDYVCQFVRESEVHKPADEGPTWNSRDYMDMLKSIPNLMELVKNPFLLSLSLNALPRVVKGEVDVTKVKVTRLTLYGSFIDDWLEKSRLRLRRSPLENEFKAAFDLLIEDGFAESVLNFLRDLAGAIYHEHDGNPVVQYRPRRDHGTWKDRFFGSNTETTLLRESSPLSRVNDQYRFMHHSLLEYFYSLYVFEMGALGGDISEDLQDISSHPLSKRVLVKESSIIQFLAEHVQVHPSFKQRLDMILERSKTDDQASQAAANAITILVRAGIRFHGADLRGIRIPGADLSYGQFDSAQLQGADLRNTTLRNIWLRQAELSGAQMHDVEFREWPYLQQGSEVYCSAYSPDGKTYAVGLSDGTISVYDTSTWSRIHSLRVHTEAVFLIVYSPSGHQIASGSQDKTVRLWDAQTGAAGPVLRGHTNWVNTVVYSPSGHQVASGSDDKTVRLWDALTGASGPVLIGHTDLVYAVVYSPSGHQIASGSYDETVRLWETQTGAAGPVLIGHTGWVNTVMYSPSGNQIVSGSDDKSVRLWDAQTGAAGPVLRGHTDLVYAVAYSPSGHQIASGSRDKTLRLWDAQTGAIGHVLIGHTKPINTVVYSPSGHQIASGSNDKTVRLWDVQTGASGPVLSGHTDEVNSVVYSPSGHQIASGSDDGTVRLWEAQTGADGPALIGHTYWVMAVVYSPSGHQIASGSHDETVRLWDAQTGAAGPVLRGHTDRVYTVVYSPTGHQIASGSEDKTVRLWDAQTGAVGDVLIGHTEPINTVVYSPSGHQIASGSDDKTVRLWEAQTGAAGPILCGHTDQVYAVVYSPSGHQIASGSDDKTVRLWDAQTGAAGPVLIGHASFVNTVVYSPGGHQIASGSDDKTVRLWDAQTGAAALVLIGHTGWVRRVVYSPCGHQIASGSHDETVRLWEAQTGAAGPVLRGHTEEVNSVVFSPSGHQIVSGSHDSTVRLWDVNTAQCLTVVNVFQGPISYIDWAVTPNSTYFTTGCNDGSVCVWKIIDDEDYYQVRLHWSTRCDRLVLSNSSIRDVRGLNRTNAQLLQQRGAVGDPELLTHSRLQPRH